MLHIATQLFVMYSMQVPKICLLEVGWWRPFYVVPGAYKCPTVPPSLFPHSVPLPRLLSLQLPSL